MTLRIKGATTIKGLTSVNWSPNLLFAAGEQGVWYDPSDFSTMFQDTAGTTPVTATGQSVALLLDKSRGFGANIVTNGDFSNGTTGWTASGASLTVSNGQATFGGAGFPYGIIQQVGIGVGKTYLLSIKVISVTDTVDGISFVLGGSNQYGPKLTAAGTYTWVVTAASNVNGEVRIIFRTGGSCIAVIDDVSVREVSSNYATQSTAASRPTLQIDGNGKYYLSFDGSNDFLQVASFTLPLIQRMTLVGFQENAAVANQGCVSVYPATGNDYDSPTGYLFSPSNRTSARFSVLGASVASYQIDWATSPASIIPASVITEDKQTSAGYLRVNGTQVGSDTSFTQFNANSNGGLLLGARFSSGVASPYLNGRIYGVIIRGAATSAQQITNAETYMNTRTGAY